MQVILYRPMTAYPRSETLLIRKTRNKIPLKKSIKVQTPNTPKVVVYAAGFIKPASNICLYIVLADSRSDS